MLSKLDQFGLAEKLIEMCAFWKVSIKKKKTFSYITGYNGIFTYRLILMGYVLPVVITTTLILYKEKTA